MLNRFALAMILTFALPGAMSPAQARPLNSAALTAWLSAYGAAWQTRDATAAGKLFTADASYHEMPFDAPKAGRSARNSMKPNTAQTTPCPRLTMVVPSAPPWP